MENENLHRLANLGLQTIADHHDINSNLTKIEKIAKENGITDIVTFCSNIRMSLDSTKRTQYQKEKSKESDFSALDICERIKKWFGTYHILIEIDCKKDFNISSKRTMILQSIINLVDNALYHSDKIDGKNYCKITIGDNSITVSDTGSGIPENIRDKIFELYFTTKDVSKQSSSVGGIGLYTVKNHIADCGFKLVVENNTILKGANFKIIF